MLPPVNPIPIPAPPPAPGDWQKRAVFIIGAISALFTCLGTYVQTTLLPNSEFLAMFPNAANIPGLLSIGVGICGSLLASPWLSAYVTNKMQAVIDHKDDVIDHKDAVIAKTSDLVGQAAAAPALVPTNADPVKFRLKLALREAIDVDAPDEIIDGIRALIRKKLPALWLLPLLLCLFSGCVKSASGEFTEKLKSLEVKKLSTPFPEKKADPTPIVPTLTIQDISVQLGDSVIVQPVTNCKSISYYAIDKGIGFTPPKYLNQAYSLDLVGVAILPGQFRMLAIGTLNDVMTSPVLFNITVQGAQPPPSPPSPVNPPPDNPPTPPAPTATNLQIIVLSDPNASAADQQALNTVLSDSYFAVGSGKIIPPDSLAAKGHKFVRYTVNQVNLSGTPLKTVYAAQITANNGNFPMMILLDSSGNWLNTSPADLSVPGTKVAWKTRLSKFTPNY